MKKMSTTEMLTKETWPDYILLGEESIEMTFALFGYIEAMEARIPYFEELIKTAKNFKDLKTQLTKFIEREKDFIQDVNTRWADAKHEELYQQACKKNGEPPDEIILPRPSP